MNFGLVLPWRSRGSALESAARGRDHAGSIACTRSPAAPHAKMTGITPALKRKSARRGGNADDESRGRIDSGAQCRNGVPPMRPENVPGEEQGEVDDDADHRGRDRRQRRGEAQLAMGRLDQRAAGRMKENDGRKVKNVRPGAAMPERDSESAPNKVFVQPPTKPTNATTMISGPGVDSPSARPSIICPG